MCALHTLIRGFERHGLLLTEVMNRLIHFLGLKQTKWKVVLTLALLNNENVAQDKSFLVMHLNHKKTGLLTSKDLGDHRITMWCQNVCMKEIHKLYL